MDMKTIILGVIRHGLTVAGGVLVTNGHLSSSDVEVVAGAGAILVGVIWSVIQKKVKK